MNVLAARRGADEALRISEGLFSAAFEHAAIGMALKDLRDGRWLRANRALCEMLDFGEAELTRQTVEALTHPDDLPANPKQLRQILDGESTSIRLEQRLLRRNGAHVWVDMTASAVRDSGGTPLYLVAQFQDISRRKAAEEALSQRDRLFRTLHDHAAVGFVLADQRGQFLQINPAFSQMLGYSEAELRERSAWDIVHPEDQALQRQMLTRLLAGEARSEIWEKRYRTKDGRTVWGRTTASIVQAADGDGVRLVAVVENITDRKQAEDALRESESRYAHIAENVPAIVYQFVYRPDGTKGYTFVSDSVRTLFGIEPDAILKDSNLLLNLLAPDEREDFAAYARATAEAVGSFRWEGRVFLPSGEERIVHIVARDKRLPDGGIGSDGIVIDVTELRRSAERLEASEQRYRSLFDHNTDAVFSLDTQGRFLSANDACAALSGYDREELIGRSFEPLVIPEHLVTVVEGFRAAVGGASTHLESTIRQKSGRLVHLSVTSMPMIVSGQVVGVFGIAKDLTAQRELERQLRQAQKMEAIGRLAGGVAHDFNNLLMVIKSYAGFLGEELADDSPARADLVEISNAADRATALTRQLLAFSRQQVLQPRRLELNAVVSSLAAMLRRVIGEDIQLETQLAPAVGDIHADPGQLEQVLMNLAVNARDAMPGGGTLRLRTEVVVVDAIDAMSHEGLSPGRYAALAVEDTGTGMEPAVLARMFEPFFTTKPTGRGTGLGLATVYGIVQQSGGSVYADSSPGRGSRFTVLLPQIESPAMKAGTSSEMEAAPRGTEIILLVEDDPRVRAVVRRLLQGQGYTVREAANGADAIRFAASPEERIDLVLTDIVMPGLSGRDLAEKLSDVRPSLRVLFMSGYTDDEILRRGLMQPGAAYLQKPFSRERLAQAVRQVLDTTSRTS